MAKISTAVLCCAIAVISLTSAFGCPSCGGQSESIGSRPSHYLGSADKMGRLLIWFDLGSVKLSDDLRLPVKLSFTSAREVNSTVLGQGWSIPILESRIYPGAENYLILSQLGGRTLFLILDNKTGLYVSRNTHWIARNVRPGDFEVRGPGEVKFTYHNGIVQSANFKDFSLKWIYENDRFSRIEKSDGKPILTAFYEPNAARPGKIRMNDEEFDLRYADMPLIQQVGGLPVISAVSPSLTSIASPDQQLSLEVVANRNGNLEAKLHDQRRETTKDYIWNGLDGLLKSDEKWSYSFRQSQGDEGGAIVERTNASAERESFEATPNFTKYTGPDGLTTTRYFMRTAGPAYGLPRKFEVGKNGKIVKATKWSYDEAGALIRRAVGEHVEMWSRSKAGIVVEYTRTLRGEILERMGYDDEGRLVERQTGRNLFKYSYDGGQVVMQRFVDGKYCHSAINPGGDLREKLQVASEDGSAKQLADSFAGLPIEPKAVEKALRLTRELAEQLKK
jgi:hypothetical protein